MDIVNSQGKKMIVIATLPAGVDVCITTKEQLDEFFKSNPCASLKFIPTEKEDTGCATQFPNSK